MEPPMFKPSPRDLFSVLVRRDAVQIINNKDSDKKLSEGYFARVVRPGQVVSQYSTTKVYVLYFTITINKLLFFLDDRVNEMYQVDLVPTLSALLNLPIPQNSLGVISPSVLAPLLSRGEMLHALAANCRQLMKLNGRSSSQTQSGV